MQTGCAQRAGRCGMAQFLSDTGTSYPPTSPRLSANDSLERVIATLDRARRLRVGREAAEHELALLLVLCEGLLGLGSVL